MKSFKCIAFASIAILFICGVDFFPIEENSPLTKDISYKASHQDGLKHESVDSFLDNEEVIFYKEISDFYGNSFDLYELSPSGYAIYAKNESSTAFLEGSHSSYSPFHDFLDNDLYYLGLGSYYYQEGTNVIDIMSDEPLDNSEEIMSYSLSLPEEIFIDNSENESEINPYMFTTTDGDIGGGGGSSSGSGSGSGSSGSGSSSGSTSSLTTTYNGFTCIKDYDYFKNLTQFPYNSEGTCGLVAISIVIGYMDEYCNSDYITPENEPLFKDNGGTTDALQEVLKSYGHTIPFTTLFTDQFPMANAEIRATMEDYIENETTSYLKDNTKYHAGVIGSTHKNVRKQIDEGLPVITTMTKYKCDYDPNETDYYTVGHTVVAYGYNEDDDTFLVNIGWGNSKDDSIVYNGIGNSVIVSDATIYSWNTFEYVGD